MKVLDFTEQNIKKQLKNADCEVLLFEEIGSTNDFAKALAQKGAKEGTIVIAKAQTNGRGRKGHSFFSPYGTGLYMSIVLRPDMKPDESLLITTAAAVSTAVAAENVTGRVTYIKWVNDVYNDSGKIAGILTEASLNGDCSEMEWVVLGIGVNILRPKEDFPDDIRGVASALCNDDNDIRTELAAGIINNFFECYSDIKNKSFYDEYKRRLFILNRKVNVIKADSTKEALAVDLDRNFGLIVRYENGKEEILSSGEVSAKPI